MPGGPQGQKRPADVIRRRRGARVLRQDTARRQVHGYALALGRLDTA